jgi:uracil phosphoribosyltransferase
MVMHNVQLVQTPIIQDALTHLRNKTTDTKAFRLYADRIAHELLCSAFAATDLSQKHIDTPLTQTTGKELGSDFTFITILRAGLSMMPAMLSLVPGISVGFIGVKRDETTAIANEYYVHFPKITPSSTILLADPMLATGGSMLAALEKVQSLHPKEVRIISVICAPEGIEAVHKEFPNVHIITATVDDYLNDKKYIVPGLGDYGDRYFGTK